jgi:hypothetical protein
MAHQFPSTVEKDFHSLKPSGVFDVRHLGSDVHRRAQSAHLSSLQKGKSPQRIQGDVGMLSHPVVFYLINTSQHLMSRRRHAAC